MVLRHCVALKHFQASRFSGYVKVAPVPIRLGTFLSKYGIDMTKLAHEGKLHPAVGRIDVNMFNFERFCVIM